MLPAAAKSFTELPAPGESIHYLMDGRHDLMAAITAVIAGAGAKCDHLRTATLSMSLRNLAQINDLADDGYIGFVGLVASHYFAGADRAIYTRVRSDFAARGWRVVAPRVTRK